MPFQALRLGLAFTLAGCAFSQEPPDPAAYAPFFAQIAILKEATSVAPRIGEAIGLSATEVEILRKIAADCVTATDSLQAPKRDLIFDARLEFIETGKHSETLDKKLKELDGRADELVVSYVGRLKAALPAASFEKIDTYLRTPVRDRKSLAVTTMRKLDPMGEDTAPGVMRKK